MSLAETEMCLSYTLYKHIAEGLKDLGEVPLPCISDGALGNGMAKTPSVLADNIDKIFAPGPSGPAQLTCVHLMCTSECRFPIAPQPGSIPHPVLGYTRGILNE